MDCTDKKILVTGAAGFIGMHMVHSLLLQHCEVVGLDNINSYYDVGLKYARLENTGIFRNNIEEGKLVASRTALRYRFIKMHLEDNEGLIKLFQEENFDFVIHLAGQAGVRYSLIQPASYIESNVNGFMNILEGCRHYHVRHLVYASSSSVYGLNSATPFKETDTTDHPVSLYAATKKANEVMAHSYSHLFGIPTTGMRFFTVYGPWGRPDMALFLFTENIVNGKPITVYGEGMMSRDFTYVDDVVDALIGCMNKPAVINPDWDGQRPALSSSSAPYAIYNVGNGTPIPLLQYIAAIEDAVGKKAIKDMQPLHSGDLQITHADIGALKKHIGFNPKVPVKAGVARFVNWYLDYFKAARKTEHELTLAVN